MNIVLIVVGKLKDPALKSICQDYAARIRRYCRFDEIEVRRGEDLLRSVPAAAHVVALEVTGQAVSSTDFSRRLDAALSHDKGTVAFLIGGAEGIPPAVSARAAEKLSLSAMTLPHRLARVVLCEQIYRAFTILRQEPYARE